MRIRRTSMVLPMASLTMLVCIALPPPGNGQSQDDTKKPVPAAAHEKGSGQSQEEKPGTPKKDADIPTDPAPGSRLRTPMEPALETSGATVAKVDKTDRAKDVSVPFGTAKHSAANGQKAVRTNVPDWKVKDLGDRVRFEFSTPLGPNVWIKKKSELNDMEKLAFANATATPASAAPSTPPK